MLYKVLNQDNYKKLLNGLISNYSLLGPKKINRAVHDFLPIEKFEEIDTGYKRTTLSPARKILFPSDEELVSYNLGKKVEIQPIVESEQKILFGINAWDINGMNFLDRIFSTDYVDENYMAKRKKLIVIGMDSTPSESNFALAMGASEAISGFDIFLSDLGEEYFVRIATPLGMELLNNFSKTREANPQDFLAYNKFMENYRKSFKVKVDTADFHENFEITYDNNDLYQKFAQKCFSCGSCNTVCPTCFCFNVRDDMKLDMITGIKKREWDSCMIPEYGLVAGGHNFRPNRFNRLKQRYRCKLKTYVDLFGNFACVGCGRCVEACLVHINIFEDMNSIKKEVTS